MSNISIRAVETGRGWREKGGVCREGIGGPGVVSL